MKFQVNGKQCRGVIGHSFGAYISARVAKEIKPNFLIMVSPMISLEFWLKNVIKHPKKYKFEYCLMHRLCYDVIVRTNIIFSR